MKKKLLYVVGAVVAVVFIPLIALAGDDNVPPITNALVQEECSACHFAFQPAFLPALSWQVMMQNLDDHFGEDASLAPGPLAEIEAYLVENSKRRGLVDVDNPPQRITELRWFTQEHNEREVRQMRERNNVKSLLNCVACHRGADRGIYDDD
ncbi:MAG: diheme cytochrome c [Devosiaceae bacterium]|nr:diheme cytochrome c [Devosiaceae bacterium]